MNSFDIPDPVLRPLYCTICRWTLDGNCEALIRKPITLGFPHRELHKALKGTFPWSFFFGRLCNVILKTSPRGFAKALHREANYEDSPKEGFSKDRGLLKASLEGSPTSNWVKNDCSFSMCVRPLLHKGLLMGLAGVSVSPRSHCESWLGPFDRVPCTLWYSWSVLSGGSDASGFSKPTFQCIGYLYQNLEYDIGYSFCCNF